jgi:3-oxoacyl-[acyl-carrier protein] reductase
MLPGSSDELAKSMLSCSIVARAARLIRATGVPIGRLGEPEEIAETVLWMVKTGYVTNKIVAVDGGMVPL